MKNLKKFGIFWLEKKREIHGDDYYYVLGTLYEAFDTYAEAEYFIDNMDIKEGDKVSLMPFFVKNTS